MSLSDFVQDTYLRVERACDHPRFEQNQRRLLHETVRRVKQHCDSRDIAQPLSLLHFAFRAWNREPDEQAQWIAAAAFFYIASADLFDDVQDDDLAHKPHESAGPAVAINSALALIFLSTDCLRRGMELEPEPSRRLAYLDAVNRTSLYAVGCQHGDLLGREAATTPEQVLELHKGKTSAVSLLLELGALLGGCDATTVLEYVKAGESLAGLVQIIDDLRDVYGKDESPDLVGNKMTFPLAWFLRDASPAEHVEFERARNELPASLTRIRELFYQTQVVERCAEAVSELREGFHGAIARTQNPAAAHRVLLSVVDALADSVCETEPVAATAAMFVPSDAFSEAARRALRDFVHFAGNNVGAAETTSLLPWHLPHFNFSPERGVIYYPDVDGLTDEVLPFHQRVGDYESSEAARSALLTQLPFILAHEFAHAERHRIGRLSDDQWHEEYVANRVALAYVSAAAPDARRAALRTAERMLQRASMDAMRTAEAIVGRCASQQVRELGYGVDVETAAVVHALMLLDLAEDCSNFDRKTAHYLGWNSEAVAAE